MHCLCKRNDCFGQAVGSVQECRISGAVSLDVGSILRGRPWGVRWQWTVNLFGKMKWRKARPIQLCQVKLYRKCFIHRRLGAELQGSASHSFSNTSFRPDHHVVVCWLVECTMNRVWFQRSEECHLPHSIAADILSSPVNVHYLFTSFVRNPPRLSLCFYVLACWFDIAANLRDFRAEY